MRVLTKQELKNEPKGTVYIPFDPDFYTGEINIIAGEPDDEIGWLGALPLLPIVEEEDEKNYLTQWSTLDTGWLELDDNIKYAVFSKNEIRKMIDCLEWALSGCKTYFREDEWWSENLHFPLSDEEVEDYK